MKKSPAPTAPAPAREWIWAAGLFLLVLLAYWLLRRGGFVWDDEIMVVNNGMLRSAQGLRDFWFTTKSIDLLPVTMSALWLQWQCWGAHPAGYHIVDVAAHALGVLLLWRVLLRFTPHRRLAWLAAAVFGLHPVCVASAGWISEQKNTISIIFYLTALLFFLRFLEGKKSWYWAALPAFVLALMSKGSTVMLPVILGLILWWKTGRLTRADMVRLSPFFALSFAAGLITIWVQNHKAIGEIHMENLPATARLCAAAGAVCFYAWKALVPVHLSAIYSFRGANWIPLVVLIGVVAAAWKFRASWGRAVLFGLGCFIATLLPVLGFVTMYFLTYSRVSDHWQYLALPPLLALVVIGLGTGWARRLPRSGPWMAAILLAGLFCLTSRRAAVYASEESLWGDTVNKNPDAWMAWNNLANALVLRGQIDEALHDYELALQLRPVFPDAESNYGNQLVARHRYDEALEHLRKATEENPGFPRFHFNYGAGLAVAGQNEQAEAEYKKALALQPHRVDALNNLSIVYLRRHDFDASLAVAQEAIQFQPDLPEPYLNAAKTLDAMNHTADAARYYDDYLRMRPHDAGARFEYGTMLAMHNKLAEALPQFQEVVRLRPDEVGGHCDLGNTLAALRRLPEATVEFRRALELSPDEAQNESNLANALAQQAQWPEALEHYAAAVRLKPDDAETHLNYGYALGQSGHKEEAIAQYRRALVLRPGDPVIEGRLNAALR